MSVLKWLDKNFEYVCLTALLIVMTALVSINVVLRYVFNSSFSWSDEVCCYCLALSAFFCLPCSIRVGNAIKVDTFAAMLNTKCRKVLALICEVVMIVFFVFCTKSGFDIAAKAASAHQKSPALQWPVAVLYYIVTFCFILAIVRTIQSMYFIATDSSPIEYTDITADPGAEEPEKKLEEGDKK